MQVEKGESHSSKDKLTRKQSGDQGEKEVVDLVPCPSCGKTLMLLPVHFPLFDVQCTGCLFRAQVKTTRSKPGAQLLGGGWDIMEKVLKAGYLLSPLIANHHWTEAGVEKHTILFFPFIPKTSLTQYRLSPNHRQPNYKMFRYTGLTAIPYFVLFSR